MAEVRIEVTPESLQEIGQPIAQAINEAQMKGHTIDEVLVAMMVMLGSAIRQRGARLFLDKPLREALPPIALGYEQSEFDAICRNDPDALRFQEWKARASERLALGALMPPI